MGQMIAFDPASGVEIAKEQRFPWPPNQAVRDDFAARTGGLVWLDNSGEFVNQPTIATIEGGLVVSVAINPEYTPPPPPVDQTQVRLAALQAAVDLIPLNTIHNRRWIAQKDHAKTVGIGYIKANPEADQATVAAAVLASLEAEFPLSAELGPVVVCPGIIMSYAKSAHAAGFIAAATFENLRALIVASTTDELVQMLAVL